RQDQPIDCVSLEMGQSLQIGEFVLFLKRLSRAMLRPAAWRTGESDEDLQGDDEASGDSQPPAGSWAQTISVACEDTGKAPPTPERRQLKATANSDVTQARQLLEEAHAELRKDQESLHKE